MLGGNTVPFCESSHQSFSFKTSQIEISLPDTFTRNLNKLSIKIYMFDLLYVGCLFVCLSSCLKFVKRIAHGKKYTSPDTLKKKTYRE